MKRDIKLEEEVERTIKKYHSIKKLPSAFHESSSKRGLDKGDILMIILCVLFSLFILSRIIITKVDNIVDVLDDAGYPKYIYPYTVSMLYKYSNNNSCPLIEDIELKKNIES